MKQFEFLCGGSRAPPAEPDVIRKEMDVQGRRTVNLRISDISRAMVGNVPDLLLDLLEVTAYIYCEHGAVPGQPLEQVQRIERIILTAPDPAEIERHRQCVQPVLDLQGVGSPNSGDHD